MEISEQYDETVAKIREGLGVILHMDEGRKSPEVLLALTTVLHTVGTAIMDLNERIKVPPLYK